MSAFTVYLFVRACRNGEMAAATERRLQAVQALRDELVRQRVRVSAVPDDADLAVDIINVFGTNEDTATLGGVCRGARGEGRRVLIVRLWTGEERLDFVCSDGIGRASAEHHAAKRILMWLDGLGREKGSHSNHLPHDLSADLSTTS